jgi:hypothetical protein
MLKPLRTVEGFRRTDMSVHCEFVITFGQQEIESNCVVQCKGALREGLRTYIKDVVNTETLILFPEF